MPAPDPQQAPTPGARAARTWRRYLRFFGPRAAADVDDELRFHYEMRVRDALARGLAPAAAQVDARRRLGALAAPRDACIAITARKERRMARAQLVDALVHDLRFALRTLGRQRGWTAVAVLTLALGIGANTAMFSVVDSLLLHPLPYPHADRVAVLFQQPATGNATGIDVMVMPSAPVVRAWRAARSLDGLESYLAQDRTVERDGAPAELAFTASVLPSFPAFAGVSMLAGRAFTDADVRGGARVVVLGEGFWRTRYAADRAALGTTIDLDGAPYTIIGVAPAALTLPRFQEEIPALWLPLDLARKDVNMLRSIARVRPGVSLAVAERELDSLTARSGEDAGDQAKFRAKLVAPGDMVGMKSALLLLSGAVALVLLIACANVAHLLLARAASREREMAIRAALGAGRGRLARQLLTESLVLASVGCLVGVALGWAGMRALVSLRPAQLSELAAARMSGRALAVAVLLALATAVLFGIVGAVQVRRQRAHDALRGGTRGGLQTRRQHRLRAVLVVSEMALSATLLVGASLLVRGVENLQNTAPGFVSRDLYALQVALPQRAYATDAAKSAFYSQLLNGARLLGGVRGATIAAGAPPSRSFLIGALQFEGQPVPERGATSFIDYNGVGPDYFALLGIPFVEGTTFTDTSDAAHQVIISAATARAQWPGAPAVGRRLRMLFNGKGDWRTVVGVAGDAATGGLTARLGTPMLYLPGGNSFFSPALLVRAEPGTNPIPALRALVTRLDRHVPAPAVTSVDDAMRASLASPRFTMLVLTAFTLLALALAAIGLYGVLAYAVAQRTREIGIRMALGASRRAIAENVVRQGLTLAVAGAAIGLVGAFWAARLLDRMLYGVSRGDPAAFAAGAIVLVATAVLACVVPVRRAMRVDPAIAMRAE